MSSMTLAIVGLAVAWALQGLGTLYQIRHHSAAMGEVSRCWSDGYIGSGKARPRSGIGNEGRRMTADQGRKRLWR